MYLVFITHSSVDGYKACLRSLTTGKYPEWKPNPERRHPLQVLTHM